MLEKRKNVRRKEWQRWAELTATSVLFLLSFLRERSRKIDSELEHRKKSGVGRRCFKIWVYFSISYSDMTGSKLN